MTGTEWIAFVGGPVMVLLFIVYVRFRPKIHAAFARHNETPTPTPTPGGGTG